MLHGPLLGGAMLEALLGLILCLPLPGGMVRFLVDLHESFADGSAVTVTHRCLLAVVAALLVEALWDLSTTDADTAVQAERYYRALATVYLAGFTLLMTIMIKRLFVLTVGHMRAQLDKDVMAKQAKNQAEQAEMVAKMLAEDASNKSGDATPQTKAEPPAKADAPAAPSAEAEAALRKQAEGQAAEYARVMGELALKESLLETAKSTISKLQAENSTLEQKCSDFEILFGDAPKKEN